MLDTKENKFYLVDGITMKDGNSMRNAGLDIRIKRILLQVAFKNQPNNDTENVRIPPEQRAST